MQRKDRFHDLQMYVTHDQRQRIKVLCVNPKQVRDLPNKEWTLGNRMADAGKAAREVALSQQPKTLESELHQQDKKYQRVAPLATQRIRHLLEDGSHFMHAAREQGKEKRSQAKELKRAAFNGLSGQSRPGGHDWQPKGRSVQCAQCKERLTLRNAVQAIQAAQAATCPQATGL